MNNELFWVWLNKHTLLKQEMTLLSILLEFEHRKLLSQQNQIPYLDLFFSLFTFIHGIISFQGIHDLSIP